MTNEQEKYIINHWLKMSCESLRKQFNDVFGTSYKTTAFHYHTKRLGLSKHIEHKYTEEQDAFLRDNSRIMSRRELTNEFNKKYGTSIKENAIIQRCFLRGWKPRTDGRFSNGDVPWCKTKGGREEYIKTLKGGNSASFRKGHVPHNVLDLKSIRQWGHEVKIKTNNGWENYLRYKWKIVYGDIPQGCVVISVDGDLNTDDIETLRLIPNRILTILMANRWYGEGSEIVDAGIAWGNLYTIMNKMN